MSPNRIRAECLLHPLTRQPRNAGSRTAAQIVVAQPRWSSKNASRAAACPRCAQGKSDSMMLQSPLAQPAATSHKPKAFVVAGSCPARRDAARPSATGTSTHSPIAAMANLTGPGLDSMIHLHQGSGFSCHRRAVAKSPRSAASTNWTFRPATLDAPNAPQPAPSTAAQRVIAGEHERLPARPANLRHLVDVAGPPSRPRCSESPRGGPSPDRCCSPCGPARCSTMGGVELAIAVLERPSKSAGCNRA